jgi:hypothetical protein
VIADNRRITGCFLRVVAGGATALVGNFAKSGTATGECMTPVLAGTVGEK